MVPNGTALVPLAVARDADLMLSSETLVETNVMNGAWDASTNTVQQGMKQGVAIVRDTTKNLSEAAGKGVKDAQGKFMDAVAKGAEGFGEVAGTSFAVTVGTGEFVRDTVGKGTNAAKQALQAAVPLLRADERATGDQSDDAMNSPNSLSPPPSAAPSSRRPVLESTTVLKACADGSDIQIEKLIAGSLLLCDCLEKLGPFAVILRDVRHNLRKVERSPARKAETHLRALLKAEIAQEMHPEAGKLEDNSAATGMLWTVRFMRFWADTSTSFTTNWRFLASVTSIAAPKAPLPICRTFWYLSIAARANAQPESQAPPPLPHAWGRLLGVHQSGRSGNGKVTHSAR